MKVSWPKSFVSLSDKCSFVIKKKRICLTNSDDSQDTSNRLIFADVAIKHQSKCRNLPTIQQANRRIPKRATNIITEAGETEIKNQCGHVMN